MRTMNLGEKINLGLNPLDAKISYKKHNWFKRIYYSAKDGNPRDQLSVEIVAFVNPVYTIQEGDIFVAEDGCRWLAEDTRQVRRVKLRLISKVEVPHPLSAQEHQVLLALDKPVAFWGNIDINQPHDYG